MSELIKKYNKHMVLIVTTMVLGILLIILVVYQGIHLYRIRDALRYTAESRKIVLLNVSRTILLLLSAILMGTLVWVIVSMAIPKGTYLYNLFNNDYVIITIGVLLWIIGPVQLLISGKSAEARLDIRQPTLFNLKYVMGLITTWILFAGIIGIILWKVVGNKETISDYFIQGTGIASLIVFSGVFVNLLWVFEYKLPSVNTRNSLLFRERYDDRNNSVQSIDQIPLDFEYNDDDDIDVNNGNILEGNEFGGPPDRGGKIGRRRHRSKK
jgi:hypothetical protein